MSQLCHSPVQRHEITVKNPTARRLRAARVYVAVCFYDSYEIAVIVAIAPEEVEQFVLQTVSM